LRAARAAGLPTGGTAPLGYATEAGARPDLLRGFGLVEHASRRYPARTLANVLAADLTLVIADPLDGGSALTVAYARENGRPVRHLVDLDAAALAAAAAFIMAERRRAAGPLVLNIAGNRESKQPGIEARAARFLAALFAGLDGRETLDGDGRPGG